VESDKKYVLILLKENEGKYTVMGNGIGATCWRFFTDTTT